MVMCDQETSTNKEAKARYRAVKIQTYCVVTPGKQTNNKHKVSWEKRGHTSTWSYYFFYGKGKENRQFGTGLFCTPQNNISS
jgi:hypothetical protein